MIRNIKTLVPGTFFWGNTCRGYGQRGRSRASEFGRPAIGMSGADLVSRFKKTEDG
jgi:hypothetical protein